MVNTGLCCQGCAFLSRAVPSLGFAAVEDSWCSQPAALGESHLGDQHWCGFLRGMNPSCTPKLQPGRAKGALPAPCPLQWVQRAGPRAGCKSECRRKAIFCEGNLPSPSPGGGGELRVSRWDGRAPERDLISFPIIFSSCINFPYLKQILPENTFCVSGPVKTPPVTTCACPLLAASAKSQQFYILLY